MRHRLQHRLELRTLSKEECAHAKSVFIIYQIQLTTAVSNESSIRIPSLPAPLGQIRCPKQYSTGKILPGADRGKAMLLPSLKRFNLLQMSHRLSDYGAAFLPRKSPKCVWPKFVPYFKP